MSKILGKDVTVAYQDADGVFRPLLASTSCTIKFSTEKIAISSFTSGNDQHYVPGMKNWKITNKMLLLDDESTLFDIYNNQTIVKLKFSFGNTRLIGNAFITDIDISGQVHEMGKKTVTLQGTGKMSRADE